MREHRVFKETKERERNRFASSSLANHSEMMENGKSSIDPVDGSSISVIENLQSTQMPAMSAE